MTDRQGLRGDDARRAARLDGDLGRASRLDGDQGSVTRQDYYGDEYREEIRRPLPPDPYQPLRASWDPTDVDDSRRHPRPERKKQSRLGRFVSTYGWRAYALPVLLFVTVLVVVDAVRGTDVSHTLSANVPGVSKVQDAPGFGALSRNRTGTGVIGAPAKGDGQPRGDGHFAVGIPSGALPEGGPFTVQGKGGWHVVAGTTKQVGRGAERVFNYTVEVEDGIDTSSFGGDDSFASMVDKTLQNPKSWTKDPKFALRRIDKGRPDFRVSLTSQMATRKQCGFDIPIDSSCYNQDSDRVVLDEARWVRGAMAFQGDIGSYRQYMVNHEVGHAIGYQQHQPCETDGGLAPVMMQQTFGTADNDIAKLDPAGVVPMDGKSCHFNPWPYPRG